MSVILGAVLCFTKLTKVVLCFFWCGCVLVCVFRKGFHLLSDLHANILECFRKEFKKLNQTGYETVLPNKCVFRPDLNLVNDIKSWIWKEARSLDQKISRKQILIFCLHLHLSSFKNVLSEVQLENPRLSKLQETLLWKKRS